MTPSSSPTEPAAAYDVAKNRHTLEGARGAFRVLFGERPFRSLLDVGCGPGMWLRAAMDCGVEEVWGVDVAIPDVHSLAMPIERIFLQDLTADWDLRRRFDVVLCLEVAEHLPDSAAETFIRCLVRHSDRIIFSAANPWQIGQNHLNKQWPVYWQEHFNRHGFACRDSLRWKIWEQSEVEPWYRQNMFLAERSPQEASQEPRIHGVIHPDYLPTICQNWMQRREGLVVVAARSIDRWVARLRGRKV